MVLPSLRSISARRRDEVAWAAAVKTFELWPLSLRIPIELRAFSPLLVAASSR